MLSLITSAAHGSGLLWVSQGLRRFDFVEARRTAPCWRFGGWIDGDARRGAVGQGQHHPPQDLVRREAVLAVGVAVAHQVGLAEGDAVVGGRPDVGVGERRHDRGAAVGLVEPELLVGRVEQQIHPRGHVSRDAQEVAEPAGVGRPGHQRDVGLDRLEPRLHPADEVFHAAVGPVLVAAEGRVVHVGVGDLRPGVLAVVRRGSAGNSRRRRSAGRRS